MDYNEKTAAAIAVAVLTFQTINFNSWTFISQLTIEISRDPPLEAHYYLQVQFQV
jgi:hypothetical protein